MAVSVHVGQAKSTNIFYAYVEWNVFDGRSAKHAPRRIYSLLCVFCAGKSQRIFIIDTPYIVHSIANTNAR